MENTYNRRRRRLRTRAKSCPGPRGLGKCGARRRKAPKLTGNDGLIRAARVRTSNGFSTNRTKTKLYPLELSD
ncbi:hypothetical protein DPMN_074436 [Dreissena polymorpha]|uniref:Uncharacterized protein n=1 Tax=Dreissena polymorpha TaxID=45954 RepID=A0A9D4BE21_DREPO|nr:hypothetical protein DPMN_074436 [Dreissena polymorpha]